MIIFAKCSIIKGSEANISFCRLYYGSGERRLIAMPSSDSMFSQFNDSRPPSTFLHKAPSLERLANNLYSPRWRPREQQINDQIFGETPRRSMEITPNPLVSIARGLKKQTSSIWSPHLHRDKRANIYSIWEPPSANWADENGSLGRRNIQFVLFVIGFIFPFGKSSSCAGMQVPRSDFVPQPG